MKIILAILLGIVIGFGIGIMYASPINTAAFKGYCEKEFNRNFDLSFQHHARTFSSSRDSMMYYKGKLTAYFEMKFYNP